MFKSYWRYFYRMAGIILLIALILGASHVPNNLNANKNFINNVLNPFLYPQSQPKNIEDEYLQKNCPPNKQNTKECQLYVICDDKGCHDQSGSNH